MQTQSAAPASRDRPGTGAVADEVTGRTPGPGRARLLGVLAALVTLGVTLGVLGAHR